MYGSGYIFSKPFFTGWVVVGIIWIFCSFFGVGLFPIFEGRHTIARTVRFIYLDITGKKSFRTSHRKGPDTDQTVIQGEKGVDGSGAVTPRETSVAEPTKEKD